MTANAENNEANRTPGPAESGEQGSLGVAVPSPEISQPEDEMSGTENAGQEENSELEWGKQHVNAGPEAVLQEPVPQPVRTVFRKTELHGATRKSTTVKGGKTRRRTIQSRERPGVMMSYHTFEVAFKDLICSLMERQDMMGEDHLLHITNLQQQITALEGRENEVKMTVSGTDPEEML
jgi:hypothetical protein